MSSERAQSLSDSHGSDAPLEIPGEREAVQVEPNVQPEDSMDVPSASTSPSYELPEIEALSSLIKEEDYRECFRRLYKSHYGLRLKQEKNAMERRLREPGQTEGYYESPENTDEISIRNWLKYALPREGAYLLSLVPRRTEGEEPEPISMDPPSPEDDRTYSLSESEISEEDIESWRTGLALGVQILELRRSFESVADEIKANLDSEGFLQREYFTEDLKMAITSIRSAIAKCYGPEPPDSLGKCSTSTSCDLDERSFNLEILRRDSATTDSEMNPDALSDVSDSLTRNSSSATPSTDSYRASESSGPPSQLDS